MRKLLGWIILGSLFIGLIWALSYAYGFIETIKAIGAAILLTILLTIGLLLVIPDPKN